MAWGCNPATEVPKAGVAVAAVVTAAVVVIAATAVVVVAAVVVVKVPAVGVVPKLLNENVTKGAGDTAAGLAALWEEVLWKSDLLPDAS